MKKFRSNSTFLKRSFIHLLTIFLFALPIAAKSNYVGSKLNGTLSAAQINQRAREVFPNADIQETAQAVDLHKVSYRSLNDKNNSVVLSGLVALPKGEAPKGLVIFNHGTTTDRNMSPSRYKGDKTASETELAILAFASGGYAVAMPDYLGLGDEKGFHPYPLGAVNALSAIDIIAPARLIAERQRVKIGSKLFVTGYSEGGAAAMWTARELEKRNGANYDLTAFAPLSGPYDLSGTTREWLLTPTKTPEGMIIRLYLLSYMTQYFHKSRNTKLTDYFKPAMALAISTAYNKNRKDDDIIKRLGIAATLMRAKTLEDVLTPRFKKALETLDTSDIVIREMQKNDVYDWKPRAPMLLVYLEGDAVVDQKSSEKAFRTIKNNGANIERFVIKDQNLNHITAAAPALWQARLFFDRIK